MEALGPFLFTMVSHQGIDLNHNIFVGQGTGFLVHIRVQFLVHTCWNELQQEEKINRS